mmetsp:Transcript_80916/g.146031  ORF Transcript_80916/g.146031 Transcript_80916/m.146031 type:complete len:285 (+) Transcript_80916:660-1514(+)
MCRLGRLFRRRGLERGWHWINVAIQRTSKPAELPSAMWLLLFGGSRCLRWHEWPPVASCAVAEVACGYDSDTHAASQRGAPSACASDGRRSRAGSGPEPRLAAPGLVPSCVHPTSFVDAPRRSGWAGGNCCCSNGKGPPVPWVITSRWASAAARLCSAASACTGIVGSAGGGRRWAQCPCCQQHVECESVLTTYAGSGDASAATGAAERLSRRLTSGRDFSYGVWRCSSASLRASSTDGLRGESGRQGCFPGWRNRGSWGRSDASQQRHPRAQKSFASWPGRTQ